MRRLALSVALLSCLGSLGVARAADSTKLTDVRVAMDDGTLLAADVYIPTVADGDGDGLYPCVVEMTPYRKESRGAEGASYLPGQGVALIEVDARGTGGSNGEYDIVFSTREQRDAAEWIDWAATAARKPDGSKLCEDTVGMYGGSYSGIVQYLVASLPLHPGDAGYGRLPLGSEHLAAIAPQRAYGDLYRDIVYHGGIVIGSFGTIWSGGTTAYYTEPPTDAPGAQAQSAWTDHLSKNEPMIVNYLNAPYADATYTSRDGSISQRLYEDSSVLARIENLRVPTLHLAGEFDAFTRGQLRTFTEALALERARADRGPNFLILGPWNHEGTHFINPDEGYKQRLGDWYRYWLEGRANGAPEPEWMATGPRVTYFQTTTGIVDSQTPADGEWRTADEWPPPAAHPVKLHLGPSDQLQKTEDFLVGSQAYAYTPTTGKAETWSRWDNAAGIPVPQQQLDQRIESGQGVTFSTNPLDAPLSLDGPIELHLVAGTTGVGGDPAAAGSVPGPAQLEPPYHDTDFIAKLSDVAPDGTATLLTQGYLRASERALDPSRSQYLGGELIAPYHPHTAATLDIPDPAGAPRAYDIEIWPVAKTFATGHSLRLDIYSADTPNHLTLLKPAINTIWYGGANDSYLTLPVTDN